MRACLLLPLLLPFVGCSTRFKLDPAQLTCGESYHTWNGGLTNHVMQGDGGGEFDYDPFDPNVSRLFGAYDLATGDFWWKAEYLATSARVLDTVVGFGTIWTDGDLDTEYDLGAELRDGRIENLTVRELRLGCGVKLRIADEDGGIRVYDGTYAGGGLDYLHEYADGGRVYEAVGRKEADGSFVETLDVVDGAFSYQMTETGAADGTVTRAFDKVTDAVVIDGEWSRAPSGVVSVDYTFDPGESPIQTWTYEVDVAGDGGGRYEKGRQSCDLSFEAGVCTQSACTDGTDGPCQPPVEIPEWLVRL